MKCNVGGWDRALRSVISLGALGAGIFAPVSTATRASLLGLSGIVGYSAVTGYCPMNERLGVNTCRESIGEAAERVTEALTS